ncbi:hypothetical protein B0H11DRAFT_2318401 [Mycena galericulata]|nr:hypothetical protein B0H11DRAFT_2318401 [Mycena galericulata]
MPPSGDSVAHGFIDRACHEVSCLNTKLKGSSMSFCKQCTSVFYCSAACQRKDWPRHKSFCRMQATALALEATAGRLPKDFEAWRHAMGPPVFSCICVGALELKRHPENLDNKFVFLTLRERKEGVTTPAKAFEYEDIQVFDRSELSRATGAVNGDAIIQHVHDADEQQQMKSVVKARAGLVVIKIKTPDGARVSLLRASPVSVVMSEVEREEDFLWEHRIRRVINEGINMKHLKAKQEKNEMLGRHK